MLTDVTLADHLQPLFHYGDEDSLRTGPEGWRDYVAELGLTAGDAPQLLIIVEAWFQPPDDDDARLDADADSRCAAWCAPIHAWRALGQLGAQEAVAPLLGRADLADEQMDDWSMEDWPHVFGMIGPGALEALAAHAADARHREFSRVLAIEGLKHIAERHAESRERMVGVLTEQLRRQEAEPIVNGCLTKALLDLKATEAAEAIERAYAADLVDESICGSWGEVRSQLGVPGLGLASPERRSHWWREYESFPRFPRHDAKHQSHERQQAKRTKAKRKAAAKSRKRNRRAK